MLLLFTYQIGGPFGSYLGVLGPGLQSSGCHSLHCTMQTGASHLSQSVEQRMHTCRLQTGQGNSAPRLLQRSHSLKSPVKGNLLGGASLSNIVKMLFSNAQMLYVGVRKDGKTGVLKTEIITLAFRALSVPSGVILRPVWGLLGHNNTQRMTFRLSLRMTLGKTSCSNMINMLLNIITNLQNSKSTPFGEATTKSQALLTVSTPFWNLFPLFSVSKGPASIYINAHTEDQAAIIEHQPL